MNLPSLPTTDRILEAVGLETRRSTTDVLLPAIGIFAAGLLVGAGLGLLFAPKSGRDLRNDISDKVSSLRNRNKSQESMTDDTRGDYPG